MEKENQVRNYLVIILAMLFFSLSFVWFKVANITYKPLTIVIFRLVISATILFLYTRLTRNLVLPGKKDLRYIMLLAFFEPFLYFLGESFGLQYISSTVAAVIISTIPLVSPFAAYLFYREKVSLKNVLGIIISFIGVLVVIYEVGAGITASPFGVMLQFSAVFSAVIYTIILHKISTSVNNIIIILFQNIFGALYFLPLWLIFESKGFIATPFDAKAFLAIVELAVFVSSIAYICFAFSVRHMGIFKSNMFANVIPVFTAIFAWIILGDQLNLQKLVGIVIVIIGLFVAQINSKKQYDGPDPIPFE